MKSNVLITIADAGTGHRSVAESIGYALDELTGGGVSWQIIDLYRAIELPILRNTALYGIMTNSFLSVFDLAYRVTDNAFSMNLLSRLANRLTTNRMLHVLQSFSPNVVVVVQPFLAHYLICNARRVSNLNFVVDIVVSDLISLHKSWICCEADLHFVPTYEASQIIASNGVPPRNIRLVSFPVHPKFIHCDRSQVSARRALSIAESRFTILITGGGVAIGHFVALVSELENKFPDAQFLIATGTNRKAYHQLVNKQTRSSTHFFGDAQNMETLMVASDVVITKAGPSTIMEAITLRRPLIVTKAVGKQEHGNIDFLRKNDLGQFCPTTAEVVDAINVILNNINHPQTYDKLTASPTLLCHGATEIAEGILEQLGKHRG